MSRSRTSVTIHTMIAVAALGSFPTTAAAAAGPVAHNAPDDTYDLAPMRYVEHRRHTKRGQRNAEKRGKWRP